MSKMSLQCRNMSANLLAIIVMKVINQFTTFLYSIYDSNRFHYANGTCQLKTLEELDHTEENPAMNTFHTGYILCAVGGLIANTWLGFRTVLGIGGALMSVAIGLMCISIWSGLICQQGFYIFVWLFHPLYMGLVLPCLFYGFVRWSTGPVSRMVLVVVYYYTADFEAWIEVFIAPLVNSYLQQSTMINVALIGLGLSLTFVTLSAPQKQDSLHHTYEHPTAMRLKRYCKILTIFTLFTIQIDGHTSKYIQEILTYSNSSESTQTEMSLLFIFQKVNVPRLINMFGILSTSAALVLVGAFCQRRSKFLLPEQRIQIGIGTAAAVALACFIANAILATRGPTSPILTVAIFCSAALLDGVAEVLAMVAIYEFALKISSKNHKLFMVGIALSIWSLAYFMRRFLRYLMLDVILNSITASLNYEHCALHALNCLLLVVCLAYTRLVSFPMAFTLIQEQEHEDGNAEQAPLLGVN